MKFFLRKIRNICVYIYYKNKLKYFGKKTYIISPLHIQGCKNISIGEDVIIEYKTWLAALPLTGNKNCLLKIGSGSRIGHFNHIYATKSIIIEEKVLTADKVYISDNLHSYENINLSILDQPILQNKEVIIGYGSWIGENVCIIGAKIGKNSVIGANSVVTKDIPDYCIAVGSPAKIIKRYSFEKQEWLKTDKDGKFL